MNPLQDLDNGLQARREQGLYRQRKVLASTQGVSPIVDGRSCLAFCSNDYLGLASDPRLAERLSQASQRWGVGSGSAHLVSGHSRAHHALEEELAQFVGTERALLFSTGYMANLGVLSALMGRGDTLLQDKLNHASLLDGAKLSQARLRRYRHADLDSLQRLLGSAEGRVLMVTDGVFSMDGDIAPLAELSQLASQHDVALLVDDAHGFGVLGRQGRGSPDRLGLRPADVSIYMATFGKALGTAGAFVAGSAALIETLIQQSRSYIYTTAMPPALAETTRYALQIAAEEQWRRDHLDDLIGYFRAGASRIGLSLMPSSSPIQPILIGDPHTALACSEALLQQGILVTAIRPPTVPSGSSRLRITLSANHTHAHLDRLLDALQKLSAEMKT